MIPTVTKTSNQTFRPRRRLALFVIVVALIAAGFTVRFCLTGPRRVIEVSTSILVPATQEAAWNAIISFREVESQVPWAMTLGLPRPTRCALEGHGVGARRTCTFNAGSITQRIERWEPPHGFEVSIVRADMPGRDWIDYLRASYVFSAEAGGTRIVRSTTVASRLRPAAYFDPIARFSLETEHAYLLRAVKARLKGIPR